MNKLIIFYTILLLHACTAENNLQQQTQVFDQKNTPAIIGGTVVLSENPISHFTVGVFDKKNNFICTGSLIKENLVLTAAHCIESKASDIVIVFGLDFSAYDRKDLKRLRDATAVKVHPEFKLDNVSGLDWHDIALVQFAGGLPDGYSTISLSDDLNLLKQGTAVQMAGYGASKVELEEVSAKKDKKFTKELEAGQIICHDKNMNHCYRISFLGSDQLRTTDVTIEGFTEKEIRINEGQGHGTCVGDSGGPLFYQADEKITLVGVTSRGSQFCDGPAIYTYVAQFSAWIQQESAQLK